MGNSNSVKEDYEDLLKYRAGYPGLEDDINFLDNYLFYSGKIPASGYYIDSIHQNWWGNYDKLEAHQSDIHWLFPVRDTGGKSLQKHEIEKITNDLESFNRFKKSYEMMLDFYGCRLKDHESGEIDRNSHWKESYNYLNHHKQNYSIITRILKCLGEFELENYKMNLVKHFIEEICVHHELVHCATSCTLYWIGTIKDDSTRQELEKQMQGIKKTPITQETQSNRLVSRIDDDDEDSESDFDEEIIFSPSDRDDMLKEEDLGEYTKLSVEEETGSRKEDDDMGEDI